MATSFSKLKPAYLLIGGLSLLLLAGLGYWFDQHWLLEPTYVLTDSQDAARRNELYAAAHLLAQLGVKAYSVRDLSELPETLDASAGVLLSTPSYAITPTRTQALLAWVANGGYLIVTVYQAYEPGRGGDPLLDSLGVQVREAATGQQKPLVAKYGKTAPALQVQFQGNYFLKDIKGKASGRVDDGQSSRLLQFQWGQGRVTVLSELGLFDNDRLADHDHADLLWVLLQGRHEVWLQYLPRVPSLVQLLWQYAWMPLAGLLITLLGAVWAGSYRLGPILLTPLDGHRSLLEHVLASGRFLWRQGAQTLLLEAVRQRIIAKLEHRFPQWQQLSPAEQISYLTEQVALSREQVALAWQSASPVSPREFLTIVQCLQHIEKSL
jgi:hypothetical protein